MGSSGEAERSGNLEAPWPGSQGCRAEGRSEEATGCWNMTLFLRSLTKGEGEWDSPLGLKDLCFQDQKDFIMLTGPK